MSYLLLLGISILLCLFIHIVLAKGTSKNEVFLYCIISSVIVVVFAVLLFSIEGSFTPEKISAIIGKVIGSCIGGIVYGVIGYHLSNLIFGYKFIDTDKKK